MLSINLHEYLMQFLSNQEPNADATVASQQADIVEPNPPDDLQEKDIP